ncbi:MAG: phosphonopyruvate decarboxylase [Lachnospiraceae bacterium]|nr:phosphonopyruvate decarboxylase [Lachnospiraceae bacterium]
MKASIFLKEILDIGIRTITGVPDSTLKQFCDAVQLDGGKVFRHYVTANEGAAVGLATGEYLASRRPCLVYLQNSGLGNIINPLASIANQEVYGIPMLFVVGWRGEPGQKDEPQHIYQGKVTCELLEVMDVHYSIIDEATTQEQIKAMLSRAKELLSDNRQYAFIVKKGTFDKENEYAWQNGHTLVREQALKTILENVYNDSYIVSTTGKISRELYEQSDALYGNHEKLFMTVGGMGHASMIAYGMAQADESRSIVCIDGDGAVMMHMGALAFIAKQAPKNFLHIVINNAAHESVGAMPTGFSGQTYSQIAAACGYKNTYTARTETEIVAAISDAKRKSELSMIEVLVSLESRSDLGRPKESARENKVHFMGAVLRSEFKDRT